jgi:hypothetical protein
LCDQFRAQPNKDKLSFKLSHPGFPGWLRIQFAVGILSFPSIQLTGGNAVKPAKLCGTGRFTEQLLNYRSFEILSEASVSHDRVLSPPLRGGDDPV